MKPLRDREEEPSVSNTPLVLVGGLLIIVTAAAFVAAFCPHLVAQFIESLP